MKHDLRTRRGREAECLSEIKEHGGFTVFWATAFLTRAHALDRLTRRKKIRRVPNDKSQFPWCAYEILTATRKDGGK